MKIKRILYTLILLSLLMPFIFTFETWQISIELGGIKNIIYILGVQFGLAAGILMFWQYLLGFRNFVGFFTKDLISVMDVHKFIGIWGILLIATHPALINIYYSMIDLPLLNLDFSGFSLYVKLGSIALTFYLVIWITSARLRKRLGFRAWKVIHFISYLIFPFVFIHAYNVGQTVALTGFKYVWIGMGIVFILLTIYRILSQLGLFRQKAEIIDIKEIAEDTIMLNLKVSNNFIKRIIPGQFIFLTRTGFFRESHPFTVTAIGEDFITISYKKSGKWTDNLEKYIEVGSSIFVDGPFGIFLQDVNNYDRINFYAGGIGITPFVYTTKSLLESGKEVKLFYACRTDKNIAYKEYFESFVKDYPGQFELIYIINEVESNLDYLKKNASLYRKYITSEVIKNHSDELDKRFHGVCGPPVFIKAVEDMLLQEGVEWGNIDYELFSY